jgi:hypothetical protein
MDIGGLGDVGPDEKRPSAGGFDLACHTVAVRSAPRADDDHLSSLPGERQRGGAGDSRTSTVTWRPCLSSHNRTPGRLRRSYGGARKYRIRRLANPLKAQASLDWPIGATAAGPPARITSNARPTVLFDNRLIGYLCKLVRRNPYTFGASPASPFCEAALADNWIGRCVGVCRR